MAGIDNTIVFSAGERLTESSSIDIIRMQETPDSVSRINHEGDPEGVVSANPSSLSHDPDSGNIYYKQTGTGNTGWVQLNGGGGAVTITADDGNSLTTSPYDLFGQKAGTVAVMSTAIAAGNLLIANNAWETQYVVDASTTDGLKGTFQTIQAAMDQAVLDGMLFNAPRVIRIRTGTYSENLNIPGGAILVAEGFYSDPTMIPAAVTIVGSHTGVGICLAMFRGINFQNGISSDPLFDGTDTAAIFCFQNCNFSVASVQKFMQITAGFASLNVQNCYFNGNAFGEGFTLAGCPTQFDNCQLSSIGINFTGNVLRINNTLGVGPTVLTSCSIIAADSSFSSNSTDNVTGTVNGSVNTFRNCLFNNNTSATSAVNVTGSFQMPNCGTATGAASPKDLYPAASKPSAPPGTMGGVIVTRDVDTDYVVNLSDFGISVTDTSAPVTITLPNSCSVDKIYYVGDASGGAGTNNITIDTVSPFPTIDGQLTKVINQNYGAFWIRFDGTNYFTIAANSSGGGAGITYTPDQGGAISPSGNLNVKGATYGTSAAPTLDTNNVGGDLIVQARAYETPYVVDASSTVGMKGTYSTIQSAIAAAVTDGAAIGNYKKIYIRTGTYTEDLTLPAGIMLVGQTFPMMGSTPITPYQSTVIVGNHTFSGSAVLAMENLNFIGVTGDLFTDGTVVLLNCQNCFFANTADYIFNITSTSSALRFFECTFGSSGQDLFNMAGNELWMRECHFEQTGQIVGNGTAINIFTTTNIGGINGTNCQLDLLDCTFSSNTVAYYIAGTNGGSIKNTYFGGTASSKSCIQSTNTCFVINCSTGGTGPFNSQNLTETGMVYVQPIANQGNVMQGTVRTIAGTTPAIIANNSYFNGINNTVTGIPVLFNGPSASGIFNEGQVFIVKDITGNAGTNNIEITSSDGILFDGQTSIFITTNWGSVTLRFDGTNFNII